ncbi:MAG: hypothetical protein AAFO94_20710, partial [Bacteroidota bacterium]
KLLFYFKMIPALITEGNHQQATQAIDKALSITNAKSHNYSAVLMYQAIAGHWSDDDNMIQSAMVQWQSSYVFDNSTEQWHILQGFQLLRQRLQGQQLKKVRIQKFLNQIRIYQRDKAGNNINLLILQLSHLLLNGDQDRYYAVADTIDNYLSRYLRGAQDQRPRTFLKMLAKVPAGYFKATNIAYKTKHLRKQLDRLPVRNVEVEIVPFGKLWNELMAQLQ